MLEGLKCSTISKTLTSSVFIDKKPKKPRDTSKVQLATNKGWTESHINNFIIPDKSTP